MPIAFASRLSLLALAAAAAAAAACRPAKSGTFDADEARTRIVAEPITGSREDVRLCGYLAFRPEVPMRVPMPAGADTAAPRALLGYIDGRHVTGVRVVTAGPAPAYVFSGITDDGRTRVTFAQPITGGADAVQLELSKGAGLTPPIEQLDLLLADYEPPASAAGTAIAAVLPDTLDEPDRAVPDLREIPDSPVILSDACPSVTLGTKGLARLERSLRVPMLAGQTLVARARGADVGVVLAFDEPAKADSGRANVRRMVTDSITVTEDREVLVRLTIVPRITRRPELNEPNESFVTLSLVRH